MKITHIIIGLGIGGAELMLKRLVEGLNGKEGMQHSIISLTELGPVGKQLQEAGFSVKALGMKNALSLPVTFLKLRSELKMQNPHIVQTWMYHADFLGGLAAKSLGNGNIMWGIRTTDVTQGSSKLTIGLRKLCAWLSYSIPKVIICAADAGRKEHEKVGYDPQKMRVIPNGFDQYFLKKSLDKTAKFRSENGLLEKHIVIGSVGRFNVEKNQKVFVDAAALIADKHENVRFLMVGRDNTVENLELLSWITKYQLQHRFILLGERSDIPTCLASMDIFCLHSNTEGFPNVLGEAMAMGVPCVSTDVGDARLLLNSRGWIVGNSAESIASQINKLLLLDYDELKAVADSAQKHLFENYSISSVLDNYKEIYKKLMW